MLPNNVVLQQVPPLKTHRAQLATVLRLDTTFMVVMPFHISQCRELGATLRTDELMTITARLLRSWSRIRGRHGDRRYGC